MDTAKQGSVSTKTFVLSLVVVGVAILISGALFHMAIVRPLQIQVQQLTDTVNHNAEVANRAVQELTDTVNRNAEALNSLTTTVNHNAEAANRATRQLGDVLDSLTDTVNHNAEIANRNNLLR